VELLLGGPAAPAIRKRLSAPAESLHAPHLIDVELAQVLRRFHARGELGDARAREALSLFAALEVTRYAHQPLMSRVWAWRASLTAYDAVYVALAEALPAPLLTLDRKLAAAADQLVQIEMP
jgi:predicted nucleic acid-binding protein